MNYELNCKDRRLSSAIAVTVRMSGPFPLALPYLCKSAVTLSSEARRRRRICVKEGSSWFLVPGSWSTAEPPFSASLRPLRNTQGRQAQGRLAVKNVLLRNESKRSQAPALQRGSAKRAEIGLSLDGARRLE